MTTLQTPPPTQTVTQPPPGTSVVAYAAPAPKKHRPTDSVSRTQKVLAYLILALGSLVFLVPFYFVVNGSLKSASAVLAGDFVSLPKSWQAARWHNYPDALAEDKMDFRRALANTVVVTTLSVVGQIISCSLVGFGFARFKFRGRAILFMVMLSTMMLPSQVTMIPVFVLFRSLHMVDTFWPLVIPMWLASPFFVFMFRQFFAQIPEELVEAARVDGASNWRIYWQLMLPLSGPVIAIVAIYTFLATWNDFLNPLIYLNSPENRTLALALNAFNGQYGTSDAHLLMAASVVCMLPCVILFFAAQKYFVESVAMTGLKA
jgi:multiple sugar transport system permease protein